MLKLHPFHKHEPGLYISSTKVSFPPSITEHLGFHWWRCHHLVAAVHTTPARSMVSSIFVKNIHSCNWYIKKWCVWVPSIYRREVTILSTNRLTAVWLAPSFYGTGWLWLVPSEGWWNWSGTVHYLREPSTTFNNGITKQCIPNWTWMLFGGNWAIVARLCNYTIIWYTGVKSDSKQAIMQPLNLPKDSFQCQYLI